MPTNNVSKLLERVLCGTFDPEHQEASQIIQWGKLGDTWCAKKPFENPRVSVYKSRSGEERMVWQSFQDRALSLGGVPGTCPCSPRVCEGLRKVTTNTIFFRDETNGVVERLSVYKGFEECQRGTLCFSFVLSANPSREWGALLVRVPLESYRDLLF